MSEDAAKKPASALRQWGPTATIAAAAVVEVLAAAFFVGDSLQELATDASKTHSLTELPVALALCIGTWFTIRELRRMLQTARERERALALASGAFLQVVEKQFDLWHLTPAEKDVAWLSLKGLDVAEIAAMRHAANGTVRAQLARIYGKSGVTSRAQFASIFVDELMGRLPDREPQGGSPVPARG